MRKNENKKDNLFILNVINVSEQHSRDFSHSDNLGNANASDTEAFL